MKIATETLTDAALAVLGSDVTLAILLAATALVIVLSFESTKDPV